MAMVDVLSVPDVKIGPLPEQHRQKWRAWCPCGWKVDDLQFGPVRAASLAHIARHELGFTAIRVRSASHWHW